MKHDVEFDPTLTVNEITARYPETIVVFNDFGIDACCGGDVPLAEAAARDGADAGALTTALKRALAGHTAARQ